MKKENFARVYEEYHKLVLHIAFDGLKDYDLAQDVCQEVFIAFNEKIDGLDEELVKGWFVKNANRKTVDVQRKPYRKNEISKMRCVRRWSLSIWWKRMRAAGKSSASSCWRS